MAFLTDRTLTTGLTTADLFHIVNPNDTSQNPAGSSYKANIGQLLSIVPPFSGGSGNCITDFYVTNVYGCSPITIQSELNFNTSTASGTLSFAQGQITNAIGNYSHSQGRLTNATGDWSHAEGRAVQSLGQYSHAEGVATISSGTYSHSEGDGTESSGVGSHSEGQSTIASGGHSHAEGRETESFGEYSHSEGWGTIAGGDYQHVQGQYNLSSTTQSAFIIGNGVDNSNRSNLVFAVGNQVDVYGDVLVTGTTTSDVVSATTSYVSEFLQFNTGSSNPSIVSGRVFYDDINSGLTYYSYINPNVKINVGKQLFLNATNSSGSIIPRGSAVAIQSATNGIPNITLLTSSGRTNNQVVGLVAEDIQNGEVGLVLTQGIFSGLTTSYPVGTILYLSDTVPGGYVSGTTSLEFSSRSHQIGYVIESGTTTGKIYVSINNEDTNLTLTDIERNILEGNTLSTGTYDFTGLTRVSNTLFSVAPMRGWIVKNTGQFSLLPEVINIDYSGTTGTTTPFLTASTQTYVLVTSASTLLLQTTFPTPQERRENIFLGKVIHPLKTTIQNVLNTVDHDVSPMSSLRDLWEPLKLINEGIIVSPNGVNMNINTSAGILWGNGINWPVNQLSPNNVYLSGTSPTTFQYRVQTGGTFSDTITIDPANYDNGGVLTAVGGGSNSSTNQRIYIFPTGVVRIQYGQTVYGTLAQAVAAAQTESFVEFVNNRDNGILIGILSVNKNASVGNGGLVNTTYAVFSFVSKFGEVLGGTGGISTTTLQQAYNNSAEPEIVINSTLDGFSIKNGTGNADNVTKLFEGISSANTTTSFIRADGYISGSSFYGKTVDVSGTTGYNQLILQNTYTPSGTTDTNGIVGDISWDTSYIYVKTSGGWKRSSLSTW
mgnify:CR=1 FL=1